MAGPLDSRLRPEASNIDWDVLSWSQREAFRRILYMLQEAWESIGEAPPACPGLTLIQERRKSQVAFMSGARGSGKTSVALSLMQATLIDKDRSRRLISHPSNRFQRALEAAKKRVVWLEPIDLDPLPEPFDLIPAILERVEAAVYRILRDTAGSRSTQHHLALHQLQLDFQEVYRAATLAWNSNIRERRSELDPDFYADEVRRTNSARLSLGEKVDCLLAKIGKEQLDACRIERPIFVVTIDDFDMHPTASLHILKLLRLLSCPRLFFLLLGEVQILEVMSDIGKSAEFGSVLAQHIDLQTLGVSKPQLARLAGSISRNAIRKLLPMEQRCYLKEPFIEEGLLFAPVQRLEGNGNMHERSGGSVGKGMNLRALCNLIPFRINSDLLFLDDNDHQKEVVENAVIREIVGKPVETLYQFLTHGGFQAYTLNSPNGTSPEMEPNRNGVRESLLDRLSALSDQSQHQETARQEFNSDSSDQKDEFERLATLQNREKIFEENVFWANHLFATTPRRLADFWFMLRRQVTWIQREIASAKKLTSEPRCDSRLVQIIGQFDRQFDHDLARICRDLLLEELAFTPLERERIAAAFTPSSVGDFNWSELPIRLVAIEDPPFIISGEGWATNRKRVCIDDSGTIRNLYHEIRVKMVKDWTVVADDRKAKERESFYDKYSKISELRSTDFRPSIREEDYSQAQAISLQDESIDSSRELSRSTSSMVMLLHDKIKLCNKDSRFSSRLLPEDDGALELSLSKQSFDDVSSSKSDSAFWCKWASTQYRGSYHNLRDLYWPAPNAMSIWSMDQFRRSWNSTVSFVRSMSGRSEKDQVSALAFGWIAGGCAVIDAAEIQALNAPPTEKDWRFLHDRLNKIAGLCLKPASVDSEHLRCARKWLQNVIVMLMPEMGLPTHLLYNLLFGLQIKSLDPNDYDSCVLNRDALDTENLRVWECLSAALYIALVQSFDLARNSARIGKPQERINQILDNIELNKHIDSFLKKPTLQRRLRVRTSAEARKILDERAASFSSILCEFLFEHNPILNFAETYKTEIRARRGVRLSLISHISRGRLADRLRRSQCIFLAPPSHTDWTLMVADEIEQAFTPEDKRKRLHVPVLSRSRSKRRNVSAEAYLNRSAEGFEGIRTSRDNWLKAHSASKTPESESQSSSEVIELPGGARLLALGCIFRGGGLVPHSDEFFNVSTKA